MQKRNVDKQPATFCENTNNQRDIPSVEDLPYVNLLKLGIEAKMKSAAEMKLSNQVRNKGNENIQINMF